MKFDAGAFWLRMGIALIVHSAGVLMVLSGRDHSLAVLVRPALMQVGCYILWLCLDTGWRNALATQAAVWSARCLTLLQAGIGLFAFVRFVATRDWSFN